MAFSSATPGIATTFSKAPADITILRAVGAPFTEEADGRIANQIRVKITNRRDVEAQYTLAIPDLQPDVQNATKGSVAASIVAPENPLIVAGGATRSTSVFIVLPRTAFRGGQRTVGLVFTDGQGYTETVPYRLLGPSEQKEP